MEVVTAFDDDIGISDELVEILRSGEAGIRARLEAAVEVLLTAELDVEEAVESVPETDPITRTAAFVVPS